MIIHKSLSGSGVCAREVEFIINNGVCNGCSIVGGCDGQSKALNALVAGMPVDWIIERLSGIRCGQRNTSCSAELAKALQEAEDGMLR